MAAEVTRDELAELLSEISALLYLVGEDGPASSLADLSKRVRVAKDRAQRQELVRLILRLYGGMGSFQDFVLQDERGVLPEQRLFGQLQAALYDVARAELR